MSTYQVDWIQDMWTMLSTVSNQAITYFKTNIQKGTSGLQATEHHYETSDSNVSGCYHTALRQLPVTKADIKAIDMFGKNLGSLKGRIVQQSPVMSAPVWMQFLLRFFAQGATTLLPLTSFLSISYCSSSPSHVK
jgi:hypothetical protein